MTRDRSPRMPRGRVFCALAACRRGAAVIEFALLGPLALAMLFALIEGGRIYWIKQTLDEVAYSTARCISVSSTCATSASQKAYALDRAEGYAIVLDENDVTITGNTTCKGVSGANKVSINHQINSPVTGLLPFVPDQLTATACFPVLA